MKNLACLFSVSVLMTFAHCLHGQEESEEEFDFAREEFGELGEHLREMIEEFSEQTFEMQQILEESSDEEREEAHFQRFEDELEFAKAGLEAYEALLAQHEKILAGGHQLFLERHQSFHLEMQRVETKREQGRLEMELNEVRVELGDARADGDENLSKQLEGVAKQISREIESFEELSRARQRIAELRGNGSHEEADDLDEKLHFRSRGFDLAREARRLNMNRLDVARDLEHFRRMAQVAGQRVEAAEDMVARQRLLVQQWGRIRKAAGGLDEEELERMLEDFESAQEQFHLQNEIAELRILLSEAKTNGDEEEADEVAVTLEELEEEMRFLKEEREGNLLE